MLTSLYVKFIFDSACQSVSLGDEGLFSFCKYSPIKIADVICRVVFVLFLLCFQPIVCLFLPRETSEMFCHFYTHSKNNSTSSPGLLGLQFNNLAILHNYRCHFSHIAKLLPNFLTIAGYDELCMGFQPTRNGEIV